jgi:gamma-glutamyltranspeptidase/glutathione hydrolase
MSTAQVPEEPESILPLAVPGTASLAGVEAPPRGPVFGSRLAVATDHPTASLVAMNVLQSGGNAVDAAIAAAAVNVVTKPHRTQLGGDAFALIWHRRDDTVECLNAGGRASNNATPARFEDGVPSRGPRASTVPGLVDSWIELHRRHGSRPLEELLEPAIELADRGFPISMRLAGAMGMVASGTAGISDPVARDVFLASGQRAYREGQTFRQTDLAETLRRIGRDGRDGFYAGATGKAITDAMAASGGLLDRTDLAQPTAHWHDPQTTSYAGCTVYEQALPSQGIILLEALNIVEQFPLSEWGPTSPDSVHVMMEATQLAFADIRRYAADPAVESVPAERLCSKEHAEARAAEIDLSRTKRHGPAALPSDTTSFVVADEQTVVSYIQSVYWPWGSGFVIPGTGILMNNRMRGFHTDPNSPNRVAPGKRAVHTLNTFLVLRDGGLVVGGGTPGGDFQVQTNLQTIVGVLDWALDLQSAIDAPRWVSLGDGRVAMEARFPETAAQELEARGHTVERMAAWEGTMARSQVIASTAAGGWAVASDLRGEGIALAL